jgi:hypothetical protein
MASDTDLTQKRLQELLHYDPETGVFTWLPRPVSRPFNCLWNAHYAGKQAGSTAKSRGNLLYVKINIGGSIKSAHRLVFLYMTGELPSMGVDHKDRNGLNNRWNNLRPANQTENCANRGISKNNTSGFKGVYLHKINRSYVASIVIRGKRNHLGCFNSAEEAHSAYVVAAQNYSGEFANGL